MFYIPGLFKLKRQVNKNIFSWLYVGSIELQMPTGLWYSINFKFFSGTSR